MYYEVNDFTGLHWEKKNPPLMPQTNPNEIVNMAKHMD
jgi:hypothetical protein